MRESTHPVAELLRRRRADGSTPGARRDPHRVALVLEGGGMRGVVSAGMAAAIERLGLTPCFDLVVGSSAGALNGAGLLAGVAQAGPGVYCGPLASREFINPARLLVGRPALDVRFVLRHASDGVDGDRHERTLASAVPLHCVAVDVDTAAPVTFAGMRTREELWDVLLATTRMPLFGGAPVPIGGRRFIDGALAASIPLAAALEAGATHVLILQTRPHGVPRSTGSRLADLLIERHLRRLNPALVGLWRDRLPSYERLVEDIARQSGAPAAGPPHVLGLRPPAGTPVVGQLERRAPVLSVAADAAQRLVEDALGAGQLIRSSGCARPPR
ncbi:MAG TPA: patatin-like phospholipase family protein [Baekduia sp.]|uniref:patatin-like phospholipase family protein n=1 Tax=Baekduia sp. TaxID=2600305 RepID=UPI002CAAC0D4|nr:patatin-like phospholipase family protein [Baekduia sp.]HMJ32899.1 patatin-like phospholipase family protein [Baekduia sp.]